MKELILMIARSLVDKPEEVELVEVEGEKVAVFELRVAKEDLAASSGRRGVRESSSEHLARPRIPKTPYSSN